MSHAAGRPQRARRVPDRLREASSSDEAALIIATMGAQTSSRRPTTAERDEAALIIEAMVTLKLLRIQSMAVCPAEIALALAWIRDDQSLHRLNFKSCYELFGIAEELGQHIRARWVMDPAGRLDGALFYLERTPDERAALRDAPRPAIAHGAAAAATRIQRGTHSSLLGCWSEAEMPLGEGCVRTVKKGRTASDEQSSEAEMSLPKDACTAKKGRAASDEQSTLNWIAAPFECMREVPHPTDVCRGQEGPGNIG